MATINDLVLVHVDNKPGFYARIEDISPDMKKGWWVVKLLVLTFPLQEYNWILDENQIEGGAYTMGGTPMRLEKLPDACGFSPAPPEIISKPVVNPVDSGNRPKVVSLLDRKKDK